MCLQKNIKYIFTLINPIENKENIGWILLTKDEYLEDALDMEQKGVVDIKENLEDSKTFYIKLKKAKETLRIYQELLELSETQRRFIFKQFCKFCGPENPVCNKHYHKRIPK